MLKIDNSSMAKVSGFSLIFFILMIFSSCLIAKKNNGTDVEKAPRKLHGCENIGYEYSDGKLVLNPINHDNNGQTVYFIQNTSTDDLTIKSIYTSKMPLNPIWVNHIDAGRWASFAADIQGIKFKCQLQNESEEDGLSIDCAQVLKVCEYPHAKFGDHTYGNYWMTTNLDMIATRNAVIKRGVLLRWFPANAGND